MPEIILTTLNARYLHSSFGLRYLFANLGDLAPLAVLREFDINQRPLDIVESLLADNPRIIGIGVYIWNARETLEIVTVLKRIRPEIVLILGGPEVSYETADQAVARMADYVITGEADLEFAHLCSHLLGGRSPENRIVAAPLPDPARLASPYPFYTAEDIAHRVVYVEASRGCPFTCEFCLSSLDIPVRQFPLEPFLASMDCLFRRGVRHFKFVDRTFNLNLATSRRILEFFLERQTPGLLVHFEMIPDRLPEALREVIARFPRGTLQFEIGIQTLNPEVGQRIRRRQDPERLADNLHFLRRNTGVHVHADLIAGLPGESVESFAAGFDRLVELGPQEIQVGFLKRLRGTPIGRHDTEWSMVYNPAPPYEILENRQLDYDTLQRLRRFARAWDLVANSGNFVTTGPQLWRDESSPFAAFLKWSDWLHERSGSTHGIALNRLARFLFDYLTTVRKRTVGEVIDWLTEDFRRAGRRDLPPFLVRPAVVSPDKPPPPRRLRSGRRQQRHVGASLAGPSASGSSQQVQLARPGIELGGGGVERIQQRE